MKSNPKFDAYIDKAGDFAQPILAHLRAVANKAEPEAAEETRWGVPYWILEGRQLCGMAAFKEHCAFIIEGQGGGEAMGDLGRIIDLNDLPDESALIALIRTRLRVSDRARMLGLPRPKPLRPNPYLKRLTTSPQPSQTPPVGRRSLMDSLTLSDATTSTGSPQPSARPRAKNASPKPRSGSAKESARIGNTRSAEVFSRTRKKVREAC